jgi:hypothetical protein
MHGYLAAVASVDHQWPRANVFSKQRHDSACQQQKQQQQQKEEKKKTHKKHKISFLLTKCIDFITKSTKKD